MSWLIGEARMNNARLRAPAMVLVAHGTRSAAGLAMIDELAAAVRDYVDDVRVAYVDVVSPGPADVLAEIAGPAVLVPAFLASGYHVHTDIPRAVRDAENVVVTRALGPDPMIADVMRARLVSAGWQAGDPVVFAAAGSSDRRAVADVAHAAKLLGNRIDAWLPVSYAATGTPRPADVIAQIPDERVFIASYLLAHGVFQERLRSAGAFAVADPIGVDQVIVDLLVSRYREGVRQLVSIAA